MTQSIHARQAQFIYPRKALRFSSCPPHPPNGVHTSLRFVSSAVSRVRSRVAISSPSRRMALGAQIRRLLPLQGGEAPRSGDEGVPNGRFSAKRINLNIPEGNISRAAGAIHSSAKSAALFCVPPHPPRSSAPSPSKGKAFGGAYMSPRSPYTAMPTHSRRKLLMRMYHTSVAAIPTADIPAFVATLPARKT